MPWPAGRRTRRREVVERRRAGRLVDLADLTVDFLAVDFLAVVDLEVDFLAAVVLVDFGAGFLAGAALAAIQPRSRPTQRKQ